MWFFRKSLDGNLLTGAFVTEPAIDSSCVKHLRSRVRLAFGTEPGRALHLWRGIVGLTPNGLPRLYSNGAGILGWTGCNGRGLVQSYVLGQLLVSLLTGRQHFRARRHRAPLGTPSRLLLKYFAERWIHRDRKLRARSACVTER
jgi:sarcosine oxidase